LPYNSYIGVDDEENFFTNAQRSTITWHIMQDAKYGKDEDQIGVLRLVQNNCFDGYYPLHESSPKPSDDEGVQTNRQLLQNQWSHPRNWYKQQPLNQVRRYFGEKVGIYFTWIGFYTAWLLPISLLGIVVFFYGLSTIPSSRNAVAYVCSFHVQLCLLFCFSPHKSLPLVCMTELGCGKLENLSMYVNCIAYAGMYVGKRG
jgi:hypothetical protein